MNFRSENGRKPAARNWSVYWADLLAKHRALIAFGAIPPVGVGKAKSKKQKAEKEDFSSQLSAFSFPLHPWEVRAEEQDDE